MPDLPKKSNQGLKQSMDSLKMAIEAKEVVRLCVGRGKFKVKLVAIFTQQGNIVNLIGGERSHIGAVAVAIPYPSSKALGKISATPSVFTLVGHKDNEIAGPSAHKLACETNRVAVVVVGIHIEQATKKDIKRLCGNSMKAIDRIIKRIKLNGM